MSTFETFEFRSQGAWVTSYSDHYENAWHCFHEYEKVVKKLLKTEATLRMAGGTGNERLLEDFIDHSTGHLQHHAYRAATSAHLYACMAIEGFINYYGIRRLGEDVYEDLLERKPVTDKLSSICLLCFSQKHLFGDELTRAVRTLFELRNALVHPKTKALTAQNAHHYINAHPSEHFVQRTMKSLEAFVDGFCKVDPSISRQTYFSKPRKRPRPQKY